MYPERLEYRVHRGRDEIGGVYLVSSIMIECTSERGGFHSDVYFMV
jgi:hypothetical protein